MAGGLENKLTGDSFFFGTIVGRRGRNGKIESGMLHNRGDWRVRIRAGGSASGLSTEGTVD